MFRTTRKTPIKRRRTRIRKRGKFKAFAANPLKKYKRKRTDDEVMQYALQCRQERLTNRTRAEMVFAELLDRLRIPHELEKIMLNGDRCVLLDAFVPSAMIAFEIDGEELHARQKKYDDGRSKWLLDRYGVRTVRFTNGQVLKETDSVARTVIEILFPCARAGLLAQKASLSSAEAPSRL